MEIIPENIIKRHEQHPAATKQLIETYAKLQVKEYIKRFLRQSAVVAMDEHYVIVTPHRALKDLKSYDPFISLDPKTITKLTKS